MGSLCPKGICDTSHVRTQTLPSPVPSQSLEQCMFLATRETQDASSKLPSTRSYVLLVWKIQTESEKCKGHLLSVGPQSQPCSDSEHLSLRQEGRSVFPGG